MKIELKIRRKLFEKIIISNNNNNNKEEEKTYIHQKLDKTMLHMYVCGCQ